MKTVYLIGGAMGVGKTTVSQQLKKDLANSVFLDGDWCWDMHPFRVTDATRALVLDNICHILGNFLACPEFENVVFCWVLHKQSIIDAILGRLNLQCVDLRCFCLVCGERELRERLLADVNARLRGADVIERSVARLPMYDALRAEKIDVSHITPDEAAGLILASAAH